MHFPTLTGMYYSPELTPGQSNDEQTSYEVWPSKLGSGSYIYRGTPGRLTPALVSQEVSSVILNTNGKRELHHWGG